MGYAFVYQNMGYLPEGGTIPADGAEAHNTACEAVELAAIGAGEPIVVYPVHVKPEGELIGTVGRQDALELSKITLWSGTVVGTIVRRSRPFRNPFGGTLTAYTWRDLYGKLWRGRGAGDGMMLRSRRSAS